MDVLTKTVTFEETIKGSRFLSELIPCESQSQARDLIKSQKAKYADATHVVHAFIVGPGAEIMGMSDDGEPSGTAGRPVLDVLKGRGCTNAVLTVTRWFGGTLLGTGGLVKAYGNGAKGVIQNANQQNAFEELVAKKDFNFSTDYTFYNQIKTLMEQFHFYDLKEDFGTNITVTGKIREEEKTQFAAQLLNLTNGRSIIN